MSNSLPREIADMCGIVLDPPSPKPQQPAPAPQALTEEVGTDGVHMITYRGLEAGWINQISKSNRDCFQYRALSKGGRVNLFYSLQSATAWLIEEMA